MEGALLKLGLLEDDEEGYAETLGVADGELEGSDHMQRQQPDSLTAAMQPGPDGE